LIRRMDKKKEIEGQIQTETKNILERQKVLEATKVEVKWASDYQFGVVITFLVGLEEDLDGLEEDIEQGLATLAKNWGMEAEVELFANSEEEQAAAREAQAMWAKQEKKKAQEEAEE